MRPMDGSLISPGHRGIGNDHADALEPRIESLPGPELGRDQATKIQSHRHHHCRADHG